MDSAEQLIYIDPDEETLASSYREKRGSARKRSESFSFRSLKGKDDCDDRAAKQIKLFANIGSVGDIAKLFWPTTAERHRAVPRSEFLYLGRDRPIPRRRSSSRYIRTLFPEMMTGKKVIIRTLDIGADKQADYFNIPIRKRTRPWASAPSVSA